MLGCLFQFEVEVGGCIRIKLCARKGIEVFLSIEVKGVDGDILSMKVVHERASGI